MSFKQRLNGLVHKLQSLILDLKVQPSAYAQALRARAKSISFLWQLEGNFEGHLKTMPDPQLLKVNFVKNKAVVLELRTQIKEQTQIEHPGEQNCLDYLKWLYTLKVEDSASATLAQLLLDYLKALDEERRSRFYQLRRNYLGLLDPGIEKRAQVKLEARATLQQALEQWKQLSPVDQMARSQQAHAQKEIAEAVFKAQPEPKEENSKDWKAVEGEVDGVLAAWEKRKDEIQQHFQSLNQTLTKLEADPSADQEQLEFFRNNKKAVEDAQKEEERAFFHLPLNKLLVPVGENFVARHNALRAVFKSASSMKELSALRTKTKELLQDLAKIQSKKGLPDYLKKPMAKSQEFYEAFLSKITQKMLEFFAAGLIPKLQGYQALRAKTYKIRDAISGFFAFLFGWLGYRTEKSKREAYIQSTTQLLEKFKTGTSTEPAVQKQLAAELAKGQKDFSPRAKPNKPFFAQSLRGILMEAQKEVADLPCFTLQK